MVELFLLGVLVLLVFFTFKIWSILDKKVRRYIMKSAQDKGLNVVEIRESNRLDGAQPFKDGNIIFGMDSYILGVSGTRIFFKIVESEEGSQHVRYWVRVKVVFFIPVDIAWKQVNEDDLPKEDASAYVFEEL